jgi:hypothetical protein
MLSERLNDGKVLTDELATTAKAGRRITANVTDSLQISLVGTGKLTS